MTLNTSKFKVKMQILYKMQTFLMLMEQLLESQAMIIKPFNHWEEKSNRHDDKIETFKRELFKYQRIKRGPWENLHWRYQVLLSKTFFMSHCKPTYFWLILYSFWKWTHNCSHNLNIKNNHLFSQFLFHFPS